MKRLLTRVPLLVVVAASVRGESASFLSNIGVPNTNAVEIANAFGPVSQAFTTGPNADGYVFESVQVVNYHAGIPGFDIVMRLAADNAGAPGTDLAILSGPSPLETNPGDTTNTYSTSGTVVLAPSTKYWIRMSSGGTTYYGWRKKTHGFTSTDGWIFSGQHPNNGTNLALQVTASPNARSGAYFQDFTAAAVGSTSFGDGSTLYSTDSSAVAGVQDSTLKELQLTQAGSNNTRSAFLLPDLDSGRTVYAFSAKWNMTVEGSFPDAADGVSFNFLRPGTLNLVDTQFAQESGYGRGISFGIQTYQAGSPGFYVRAGTNVIAVQSHGNTSNQWGYFNGKRHFFEVDWHYLNGLTVRMNHQTIFSNIPTYGYTPQPGSRVVFAARTGGSSQRVRLDNIAVVTGGNLEMIPLGSPYYASQIADKPPSEAFDGIVTNDNNFWVTYATNGFIGATAADKRRAILYTVTPGSDDTASHPRVWTFQGSTNAGSSWTTTDSDGYGAFLEGGEIRAWLATNLPDAFNAFRLNILANGGNAGVTRVAELQAYKLTRIPDPANWVQASEPDEGWLELTCSADGLRMAGLTPDGVSISQNFGFDWSFLDSTFGGSSMACSSDGRDVLVGDANNGHYQSLDLDDFTTQANSPKGPHAHFVACSTNFVVQASAVQAATGIWYSVNSGTNWTKSDAPILQWQDLAMSGDGRIQAAVSGTSTGRIYVSTNTGVNWSVTSAPGEQWETIAISKDGSRMAAAIFGSGGGIYYSSNTGATWTASDAPSRTYNSIACSHDGMKFVVADTQINAIYLSTDGGATWTQTDAPNGNWNSVAMSADGNIIAAGENTDSIWVWALMPGRPHVQTLGPDSILGQSATLHAQVRPFGAPTTVGFAWGTTTNFGTTNLVAAGASQDIENGVQVSAVISNLVAGTTYYYRSFATNTTGSYVSWGDLMSFTMPGLPDVDTDPTTGQTISSAFLNGTVNPKGASTIAWFAWGASTNLGNTTSGQNFGAGFSSSLFSDQITGLAAGTKYYYRAMASNQFGVVTGAIAQFFTLETSVILDATSSGSPITGSSGNSPGTQMPPMAIDNTPVTKYLNFDEIGTGFDVMVFDTGRVVRGLTLISAEDAPERDPTSFTLWGSPDGTNFTLIASNTVPAFASRNAIQSFGFANNTAYAVYRVVFPTIADAGAANSMQIAEVELLTAPEISSSSDTITATHSGTELTPLTRLIDRRLSNTNKWVLSPNAGGILVDITPAAGRSVLKAVELIGAADDTSFPERHPIAITLYGSDDGSSWFAIGIFPTAEPVVDHRIEEFLVPWNVTPYNRYRINFGQQSSGITWQLDEVRLFGDVLTPLESWRYAHFATTNNSGNSANDADPEGDGNKNLLEYASGTNPNQTNSSPLFRIALSNNQPYVYFTKDTNAVGSVTWTIQSTTNLFGTWSDRAGVTNLQDPNDPIITSRFAPAPPVSSNENFRLKVTLP